MKTEQIVRQLLIDYPFLADDDKLLLLATWKKQGFSLSDYQKSVWLDDCTTPETITRIRRELIEKGIIDQSEESKWRRKLMAKKYREKYSKQKRLV